MDLVQFSATPDRTTCTEAIHSLKYRQPSNKHLFTFSDIHAPRDSFSQLPLDSRSITAEENLAKYNNYIAFSCATCKLYFCIFQDRFVISYFRALLRVELS